MVCLNASWCLNSLALEIVNYVFAVIFTVEAIIKLIALKGRYFKNSWNIFDFMIVIGTNIGILLQVSFSISVGPIATVVRTFRLGRVFRLIRQAKSLNHLFQTLLLTLPSLGNIGGLLFLLFFIYAVMGVQLYAPVKFGDAISEHANFQVSCEQCFALLHIHLILALQQNFGRALITLMRCSTGEAWNDLMYEFANSNDCDPNLADRPWSEKYYMCGYSDAETCEPITGCGSGSAYVYFMSFTLLVTFVFLNLFIAVILEGFGDTDDDEMMLSEADFRDFVTMWEKYDPDADCMMKTTDLVSFIQELREPMGFGVEFVASRAQIEKRIAMLRLPIYSGNQVHFKDVCQALACRVFAERAAEKGEEFEPPNHKINREWKKKFQPKNPLLGFSIDYYYAALSIQVGFRCEQVASHGA